MVNVVFVWVDMVPISDHITLVVYGVLLLLFLPRYELVVLWCLGPAAALLPPTIAL